MRAALLLIISFCSLLQAANTHAASVGPLRAGAAKVDITPPESALLAGDSIRDRLFVRAILIDNGYSCAAIVGMDQNGASTKMTESVIARTTEILGCPAANYLITGTLTHSASSRGISGGLPSEIQVTDAIVTALKTAKSRLQPASIGFGTIDLDLNVNRDAYENGRWFQGPNLSGPSDKTLAVISLTGADGIPIGVFMNYRMHPINFYNSGVVSADYPGDASRWVERRFSEKTVAIFSQGSPGDQNVMTLDLYRKLVGIRAGFPGSSESRADRVPSETTPAGGERLARAREALTTPLAEKSLPAYKEAVEQMNQLVSAYGVMIGESSIMAMRDRTANRADAVAISGGQEIVTCPGRERLDNPPARENVLPPYKDADPINIKVGVLRIGDINIVSVDGDVYSEIGLRIKRESPASQTLLVTPANGMAAPGHLYVYSDAASSHLTFQVIGSRLKPGCAEDKIVGAAIKLIHMLNE